MEANNDDSKKGKDERKRRESTSRGTTFHRWAFAPVYRPTMRPAAVVYREAMAAVAVYSCAG